MNTSKIGVVLIASSTLLPLVHAAEQEAIIVTATRTAQTADQSLATVEVINRDDIEKSQAISLPELLRNLPGIHTVNQGGYGKSQAVFVRGTEPGHMLVLIDGVRAASATTGEFAWETISTDQVERIEIVYGPRTSLYGSDAIGGVINIITRKADHSSVSLNYGSFNTKRLDIATGNKLGDTSYSLSAGVLNTDGFPTRSTDTEDFGYKHQYVTASTESKLSTDTILSVTLNHSQDENEHDASTGDSESKHQVISTSLNNVISNTADQTFLLGYTLDEYTSNSLYTPSTITTKRGSASWQYNLYTGDDITTLGLDYWQDHATKDNSGIIDETIDNKAVFIQHQLSTGKHDFIFNLRADEHSEFGNKTTGSLAWGKTFTTGRMVISYGTAFKAPSVNDLFWPYSSSVYAGTTYITEGNPDIQPESSQNIELSWRAKASDNITWRSSLYHTEIDDLIDWQGVLTAPSEYTYRPTNLNSVTINGIDTQVELRGKNWQVSGNLTLLDARNNETDKQLDRRPKTSFNMAFTRFYTDRQFTLEWQYAGKRNDRDASTILDAYSLLNVMYTHDINRDLQWNLRIENLANTEYTLAQSSATTRYLTPERSAYLGLKYNL